MIGKRMPADWQPPYPAFSARFAGREAVVGYYGVQAVPSAAQAAHVTKLLGALAATDGAAIVNRARYEDGSGYCNDVCIAYWSDAAAYERWHGAGALPCPDVHGEVGQWHEVHRVPIERLETVFSSQHPVGLAQTATHFDGPVREHAYWGSMRDRIAASEADALAPERAELAEPALHATRGRRLRVAPPGNLALIRSGQYWGDCSGAEYETYVDLVRPNLVAGMDFLRDHARETGCISCRFMHELAPDGSPQKRTFGAVLFLSLEHLEAWSKSHPTHLSIFGSFMQMVQRHEGKLDLKLWHEVLVLSASGSTFEYINCHPRTGLLPFFQATEF